MTVCLQVEPTPLWTYAKLLGENEPCALLAHADLTGGSTRIFPVAEVRIIGDGIAVIYRRSDWNQQLKSVQRTEIPSRRLKLASTVVLHTVPPHCYHTQIKHLQLKPTTPGGRQTQCQGQDLLNQTTSLILWADPTCQLSCHYIPFSLSVWIHKPFPSSRSGPHNDSNVSKVNRWLK